MKKLLHFQLKKLAKWILKKYKPDIIGITGSVGKTSTKEAVYAVMSKKFKVRKNIKNYNNEIGVPLTIIGTESGFRSAIKWFKIFARAKLMIFKKDKDYPQVLILEMAADKPGDIEYLTKMAPCKIGVITAIGHVHTEYFGKLEKVIEEKKVMISHLKEDNFAVINKDDEIVDGLVDQTKAKVITYGIDTEADVRALEIHTSTEMKPDGDVDIKGTNFKISYQGSTVPIFLPWVVGRGHVLSALAAACVGIIYGMNLVEVSEALINYKPQPGRMHIIKGIKHTVLIDDSYNSSPKAAQMALMELSQVNLGGDNKKYAILGDMLELGDYTEEMHRQVGEEVVKNGIDYLVTVGSKALDIAKGAQAAGMSADKMFDFDKSEEAGRFVQDRMAKGDILLIKGSQGVRMEKIVKEVMAEPLRAGELLCRQGEEWQ